MTILRKRPLTAVALGALFVGAISCGSSTPTASEFDAAKPTPTTPTPTTPTTPASPFQLTKAVDTFIGTSGDDSVNGSFDHGAFANGATWNAADTFDGGLGTDTLTAQVGVALITPAQFLNMEVLSVEASVVAVTVELGNSNNRLTTIKNVGSSTALTVNNVPSLVTTYGMNSTGANNFIVTAVNSYLAGTTDAATIELKLVGASTNTFGPVTVASGYETFNIQSNGPVRNGGAGVVTLGDGVGNSLATVNISGPADLGLTLSDTTVTKIDATTATGALALTATAANAQNIIMIGGTGADVLNINGFTTSDTITGGSGSDTLILTNAEAIGVTSVSTAVTGVETIRLSDTANGTVITLTNLAATGLQLGSAVSQTGAILATYTAGTGTFDRQDSTDSANEATTLTMSGNATTDIMNVTLGTTAAGSTWNGTGAFTINGAETVNILSQGGAATIGGTLVLAPTSGTGTCTVTGGQSLTITGAITCGTLNASAMTGSAAITMTGGAGTVSTTATGTGNADTLIGSSVLDTLSGGGGNDIVQNAASGNSAFAANDSMAGGSGNDTFRLVGSSASATVLTGSAFISDFNVGLTVATTDVLDFDLTSLTYAAAGVVFAPGTGAISVAAAAGTASILQSITASATVAAATRVIKLATPLAFTTNINTTFQTAMAGITITLPTAAAATTDTTLVLLHDTTSARMLVLAVTGLATTTTITAASTARLIGSVAMTEADYANFDSDNVSVTDY